MTREEAIKLIDTHTVCFYNEIDSPTLQALHMAIEALEKEPKRGKWILKNRETDGNYRYMCSECGHIDISAKTQEVPYCWYCGARMELKT